MVVADVGTLVVIAYSTSKLLDEESADLPEKSKQQVCAVSASRSIAYFLIETLVVTATFQPY